MVVIVGNIIVIIIDYKFLKFENLFFVILDRNLFRLLLEDGIDLGLFFGFEFISNGLNN